MNLIDRFLQVVALNPAAPACIFNSQVISREMFHQLTCKIAIELHARGVAPGEVLGISMNHSPAHLATILALARLGAVSLPVDPNITEGAKKRLMDRYGAQRLVCQKGDLTPKDVTSIALEIGSIDSQSKLNLRFIAYWPDSKTPARIGLTSGTTGNPSAILYTHEYWLDRIDAFMSFDRFNQQSRSMPSDLHLTLGSLSAFGALFAGGVVVFHRLGDLQSFVTGINLHGVTHVVMPPIRIKKLVSQLPHEGIAFPKIEFLRIVGGGLNQHLVELATRKISPNIYLPYGTSEMGAISVATPEMLHSHPDCTGRLRPGFELQAVDPDGHVLAAGEPGELRARSPMMPQGYYLDEERTAQRFRDGWFMTRDFGFITSDGMVKIEGRVDDKINLGGLKFYPELVEGVLNEHPEVKESAVFLMDDQAQSKILVAVVVPNHKPPLTLKLVDYCQQKKLGNMTPARFVLVRELPRNPMGKIIRSMLPELLKKKPSAQSPSVI